HYFQLPPVHFAPGKITLGPGLDVQNLGHYVILPPSVHPDTGKRYLWEPDFSPDVCAPAPTPEWLVALIIQAQKHTKHTASATGAPPKAAPSEPIDEGSRERTLMSIAGAMQRQVASPRAIRAALEAENQRCVPPLAPADLDRMTASVGRYAPAPRRVVKSQGPGRKSNGAAYQGRHGPTPEGDRATGERQSSL